MTTTRPTSTRWSSSASAGLTFIHPFDDPDVIAGQGTIGMEILRQHPAPLDAIFVPVGGGGLIAGIAAYVKYLYPQITDHRRGAGGCGEPCTSRSRPAARARWTASASSPTASRCGASARRPSGSRSEYVDEIILVNTDEICAAIQDIFEDTRSIAEPAGALAVAGIKQYVARERPAPSRRWSPSTAAPT